MRKCTCTYISAYIGHVIWYLSFNKRTFRLISTRLCNAYKKNSKYSTRDNENRLNYHVFKNEKKTRYQLADTNANDDGVYDFRGKRGLLVLRIWTQNVSVRKTPKHMKKEATNESYPVCARSDEIEQNTVFWLAITSLYGRDLPSRQ